MQGQRIISVLQHYQAGTGLAWPRDRSGPDVTTDGGGPELNKICFVLIPSIRGSSRVDGFY